MLALLLAAATTQAPPAARLPEVLRDVLDDCRRRSADTITVCGRSGGDSPYRLPEAARDPGFAINGPVDSVSRERNKLMDVGASGTHSCSSSGAGGWTGCMLQDWQRADQQRGYRRPRK